MCEDAGPADRGSRRYEVLGRREPFVTEGKDLGSERCGYEICEVVSLIIYDLLGFIECTCVLRPESGINLINGYRTRCASSYILHILRQNDRNFHVV
jgi:hypothetical protein